MFPIRERNPDLTAPPPEQIDPKPRAADSAVVAGGKRTALEMWRISRKGIVEASRTPGLALSASLGMFEASARLVRHSAKSTLGSMVRISIIISLAVNAIFGADEETDDDARPRSEKQSNDLKQEKPNGR